MNQPCYQCPDRHRRCHSQCERYKSSVDQHHSLKAAAARLGEYVTRSYQIDTVYRIKKLNHI